MKVDLIWVTPEAEKLLAYMARVSNPANENNPNIAGLIKYLMRNNHWSPFEMINMCVSIHTSRAIAAQIIRHRSFSFQEFSQRYAEVSEFEPIEIRRQAIKNRQSSTDVFNPIIEQSHPRDIEDTSIDAESAIALTIEYAYNTYRDLIAAGVAKEVARMILPLSTQTHIYMNGTVRSWLSYLNLRLEEHTQKEHRVVANEIALLFKQQFPVITEAINDFNDFNGGFM